MRENVMILVILVSNFGDCFYSSVGNSLLDFPSWIIKNVSHLTESSDPFKALPQYTFLHL